MRDIDDIKADLVNLVKEAYQRGLLDATRDDIAYEAGLAADAFVAISGILGPELEKICAAERERRCVVLAVSVGETAYLLGKKDKRYKSGARVITVPVDEIRISKDGVEYAGVICHEDFGIDAFPTPEAAEVALKEAANE